MMLSLWTVPWKCKKQPNLLSNFAKNSTPCLEIKWWLGALPLPHQNSDACVRSCQELPKPFKQNKYEKDNKIQHINSVCFKWNTQRQSNPLFAFCIIYFFIHKVLCSWFRQTLKKGGVIRRATNHHLFNVVRQWGSNTSCPDLEPVVKISSAIYSIEYACKGLHVLYSKHYGIQQQFLLS